MLLDKKLFFFTMSHVTMQHLPCPNTPTSHTACIFFFYAIFYRPSPPTQMPPETPSLIFLVWERIILPCFYKCLENIMAYLLIKSHKISQIMTQKMVAKKNNFVNTRLLPLTECHPFSFNKKR